MSEFLTPPEMVPYWDKIERGEYNLPTPHPVNTILDIGACVGAFSLWAMRRWPEAYIYAYEPNPVAYDMLQKNVPASVEIRNVGVSNHGRQAHLYVPESNIGAASTTLDLPGDARSVEVTLIDAALLPACDLMKLDCEGAELSIVRRHFESVALPQYIVLEYHTPSLRQRLTYLLASKGYDIIHIDEATALGVGIMKAVRYA